MRSLRSPSLCALALLAAATHAAVITVDTLADEYDSGGDCSLREAIEAANLDTAGRGCTAGSGTDTILFDAGLNGWIDLSRGEIVASTSMEIVVEPDLGRIGLRAGSNARILKYTGGGFFRLQRLILAGGRPSSGHGGALLTTDIGDVDILECILRDNRAENGGAVAVSAPDTDTKVRILDSWMVGNQASADGGGFSYVGFSATPTGNTVEIERTSFLANSADGVGGGAYLFGGRARLDRVAALFNACPSGFGGGMRFDGASLHVQNSSFLANAAKGDGGIAVWGLTPPDEVELVHVTIALNSVTQFGSNGITFKNANTGSASVSVTNSIIAGNTGPSEDCELFGNLGDQLFVSGGYNLFGSVSDCTTPLGSDLTGTEPKLDTIGGAIAGGIAAVPTLSSDAIELVPEASCLDLDGASLIEDQRGMLRPRLPYFDPDADPDCDAGAAERQFAEWAPDIFEDGFESGNALFWSSASD